MFIKKRHFLQVFGLKCKIFIKSHFPILFSGYFRKTSRIPQISEFWDPEKFEKIYRFSGKFETPEEGNLRAADFKNDHYSVSSPKPALDQRSKEPFIASAA